MYGSVRNYVSDQCACDPEWSKFHFTIFTLVMTISIGDFLSVSLYELSASPSAPFPKYFL